MTEPWDDPPRQRENAAPVLSVAGFEGPLDWLLEMARAREIALAQLSILALVEAFAAALDGAIGLPNPDGRPDPADLSRWGDWLVMAATITLLHSRLLLPAGTPQARATQDEAEALRKQLIRRDEMSAAVQWLDQQPQLGRAVFARGRPEPITAQPVGDITALFRACLMVLRIPEPADAGRPRPPPLWRVADALARITHMIRDRPEGGTMAVFLPSVAGRGRDGDLQCQAAVASTFAAGLELARNQVLTLEQEQPFGPVAFRP